MKQIIQSKTGYVIKKLNRRKAIRKRCLDCSAGSYKEVQNCERLDCTIHQFRTGKGRQDPKIRQKAIRQYCLWCCAEQAPEVHKCPDISCPLYVFRKGRRDRSLDTLCLSEKGRIAANIQTNYVEEITKAALRENSR